MEITIEEFSELLDNKYIIVESFRKHSKASEKYIDVTFVQKDGYTWKGSIPYFYRRTGLFIETANDLVDYLNEIYPHFTRTEIEKFQAKEKKRWDDEMSGKKTTKEFFDNLFDLDWKSVKYDLPTNPNWARRIQDIKEFGYTLATDTRRTVKGKYETGTHILLVPLPKGGVTGYEVMSPAFKAKAIAVMESINVYEYSKANKHGLLPDHKFPEIRWDEETRAENPEEMPDNEIKEKFQLVDNQRNQQKREVCRKCFQTGERGKLYGINFFYEGNEKWNADIPKMGKEAEKGCIGCGWYDIQKWRESINGLIENNK
ncbi:hypothetical protein N8Z72_05950 [Polaribacter sp.]|jgi:hypothetical protein|nr:hypothetical protein [Polaribacter sp.]